MNNPTKNNNQNDRNFDNNRKFPSTFRRFQPGRGRGRAAPGYNFRQDVNNGSVNQNNQNEKFPENQGTYNRQNDAWTNFRNDNYRDNGRRYDWHNNQRNDFRNPYRRNQFNNHGGYRPENNTEIKEPDSVSKNVSIVGNAGDSKSVPASDTAKPTEQSNGVNIAVEEEPKQTKDQLPQPIQQENLNIKIKKEPTDKKKKKSKLLVDGSPDSPNKDKNTEPLDSNCSTKDKNVAPELNSKKKKKDNKKVPSVIKNVEERKSTVPVVKIKQEPGLNKEKDSSDEETSSSDSSSSSENEKKIINKTKTKKQNLSSEEVICLGNLENFENLVDEDCAGSPNKSKSFCLLCEKKGHTAFFCFMECKNCGEKYHNLKSCPKPANLSVMLQSFMEFCLNQCCQYNPDQRFSFRNGNGLTELIPETRPPSSIGSENLKNKSKRRKTKQYSMHSSDFLNNSFKRKSKNDVNDSSESISSESSSTSIRRKRKRAKTVNSPGGGFNHIPFSHPFAAMFNPAASAYNPLAAAAMMGFNPTAFK